MKSLFRILLLPVLIAVAGCATVGQDYVEPTVSLPAAWSRATVSTPVGSDELSQWWKRLGDPLLGDLIAQAMQANPDLRSAQARLREVRARRDLAAAQRAPSVSGTGVGSAGRTGGEATLQSYTAGFDASWEIDVFGEKRRALEGAEADLQSSAASVEAVRVTLAAEVARNYVELRGFQARLAIAHNNLAIQSETLQLTEWRAKAGLVGSLDVEQARSNREQTRAQIPLLQTRAAESEHRVAILLGTAPTTLHERLAAAAAIPKPPTEIAVGIPADVLRQRPDVRAAERSLAAETARVGEAEAARYPSFNLSGSIGLEALSFAAFTSGATVARSVLASVTAPIFDAGRLRQQVEIQGAVRDGAQVSYESTVLTALEDVENALVAFGHAGERRAALAEAVDAARNAELLARYRYTGGLIDFQTVLDTQRSLRTVEDSLAASEADAALSVIQLYKALGGGWSPPQQQTEQ